MNGDPLPAIAALGSGLLLAGILLELVPFLFLLAFLGLNAADLGYVSFSVGLPGLTSSIYISDVLLAGTVGTWALRAYRSAKPPAAERSEAARGPRDVLRAAPLVRPIALFMVVGLIGVFRGVLIDPRSAFGDGRFVFYPLAYFCAFDAALSMRRDDALLRFFVVVTTVVSVGGALSWTLGTAESLKYLGFPGKLAIYSLYSFVMIAAGVIAVPGWTKRVGALSHPAMIVVSGVRLSLVLAPLAALVDRRRAGRAAALLGALALGLGGLMWLAAELRGRFDLYAAFAGDPRLDPSMSWRLDYWRALLEQAIAPHAAFGVGVWGYFKTLRLSGFTGDVADSPHNCFLVLLLFGGVPLLLSYLWVVVAAARRYLSPLFRDHGSVERLAGVGLFVLACSQIAIGMNAEHRAAGLWPMMWILLGAIDGGLERRRTLSSPPSPATPPAPSSPGS